MAPELSFGGTEDTQKSTYARGEPFISGETVTPGGFVCQQCGYEYEVESGVVNLPVCPRCQNETWASE